MNQDERLGVIESDSAPVTDERPARLMYPREWREWELAVRQAAPGLEWKCCRILDADMHIRALLAANLQLRQDCERLRAELEPLRQHYLVLKYDTAEYIKEKERKEREAKQARLGLRPKLAWWQRLLRRLPPHLS